jgi:hypothetical protein
MSQVHQTVDPQVGQKRKVARVPSSPKRDQVLASPSARTCSVGNQPVQPNGEPVRRWQSRQWHTERLTGSPSQVTWSWPHEQRASLITAVIELSIL